MNNRILTTLTFLASSISFITGCSSDTGSFEDPAVSGAISNDVQTQIPDQNSFSVSREKTAVEALNLEGVTSEITVRVADRHNNPVPDNTPVKFLTNGGRIEPQCLTENGECTVVWTEQLPTPASFKAIILAYTPGEESFTDLNDNDLYDAGESFTDISEPYFDLNEDLARDASTEEFVDADGDNVFDTADGLFTGSPCVGDNTVCNRVSRLIWNTTDILLSGSYGTITISAGTLPTKIDSSSVIIVNIVDVNGNPLADGTTVTLESSDGSVEPADWAFAPRGEDISVLYKTGSTDGIQEAFKVIVTSPSGAITQKLFFTSTLAL